jgi:hypothetical protein
MPLTPYLKEAVFDPDAIEAMNTALASACQSLRLIVRDDPFTQIVARQIVDIGRTGERDPNKIRDLALLALKDLGQFSA